MRSLAANPLDPLLWMQVAARPDRFGSGFSRLRWLFPQDSITEPASSYDGRIAFSGEAGCFFTRYILAGNDRMVALDSASGISNLARRRSAVGSVYS